MAEITILIDDSAEQKRRKRQRWIEIAILLLLLPFLPLFSQRPLPAAPPFRMDSAVTVTAPVIDPVVIEGLIDPPQKPEEKKPPGDPLVVKPAGPVPPQPPAPTVRFTVTPAALHFDARGLPAQLVMINNSGRVSLQSSGDDFLVTDNCNSGLPCTAAVVFAPRSEGSRGGELRVSGSGETTIVQLSGFTPVTPPLEDDGGKPLCAAGLLPVTDPPNIHFIGAGRRTVTLSNPHPCALNIETINLMNANRPNRKAAGYKLIDAAKCQRILPPGDHCTFDVATSPWRFSPRATIAVQSSVVTP